ncbi:MAG: polyribonucleotide nucleotidyltransferase [Candidatus Marinamargulisbacteria bacterium]|nr:polyribonucleotide nucleotidyltransferase [Candidatus Marinamargulisbacteria bacterium]|tara:strand:- start:2899 stop:4983 length:2085 start_codon:yes stop_codon:yes gene_type:complete
MAMHCVADTPVSATVNNQVITLETGRFARQANGSVLLKCKDLVLLATATMSQSPRPGIDFLPLTVEFQEKMYAAGKIPGGFFKREARPSTLATLTSRLIDRSLRPVFPKGFTHDVQVVVSVLSYDQTIQPEAYAIIAASAALSVSDIPFETSISAALVTQDAESAFHVDRCVDDTTQLDAIIAGSQSAIFMIEAGANEVDESTMMSAIQYGHDALQSGIEIQNKLVRQSGKSKVELDPIEWDSEIAKAIEQHIQAPIEAAFTSPNTGELHDTLSTIETETCAQFLNDAQDNASLVSRIYNHVKKSVIQNIIITKKVRPDGRKPTEIRPISVETGLLPSTHGSALFTRGETQSLGVLTLGTANDAQIQDGLKDNEGDSRYLFHYNFPPYSVGEVGNMARLSRREIGHGALARRGVEAVLPSYDTFPYTIRLVSEILESNGSSSMASVCASCLALMDGGVPIQRPICGIAMGLLITESDHVILSDIQGMEDFFGHMDFKVVRSSKGISALQLDIKVAGLSPAILKEALDQAKVGCAHILETMTHALDAPRETLAPSAPRLEHITIDPSKVGMVIGSGGSTIRKIEEESGAEVIIEDGNKGLVSISAKNQAGLDKARSLIEGMTKTAESGKNYDGKVVKIVNFGMFVELFPGCIGLAHISKFKKERHERLEDQWESGDSISVHVVSVDGDKIALEPV